MALVNCSECNNKISEQAINCPKCGAPINLEKINAKKRQTSNGCLVILGIVFLVFVISKACSNSDFEENDSSIQSISQESPSDSLAEKRVTDSLNKVYEMEELNFKKTKAGKIQKKHPDWSRQDCENVANNKIWIGMNYDMLVYMRGKPNTVNPSNYGSGVEYQCCWDDYTPSCFYMKEDNIIYSYN